MFTLILMYNRESRYDDALRVIEQLQAALPAKSIAVARSGRDGAARGPICQARAAIEEGLARLAHDERPRAPGEESRWRYTHGAALVALKDPAAATRELDAALPGRRATGSAAAFTTSSASSPISQAIAHARSTSTARRIGCAAPIDDATCSDEARALMKRAYK